ncbi:MAG: Bug family tripartite tricarboxylate transporter substrate binding protein [Hyphomicrobiaceae bacterium]
MRRRCFLALTGAAMAVGALSATDVVAADWPDKPVKVIVPYAPGGATDLLARPWAEALSHAYGQQFVIENRGGAGGMIGTEATYKAPPDGYTLMFTPNATLTVLPSLRKTAYDPSKFTPIARTGDLICGFVIHPSVGVKTFQEMIAYAKKNPGKLMYGSAGLGTATQLRVEALKLRAGVDILHVPYRGSADALNDLLPGTVQMMNEINVLPHVKAGKLILLNVNHASRHPDFPDVPTLTELGVKDADVPIWYSMWGPPGLSQDLATKLNQKIVEIAKSDDMKKRMRELNTEVPIQTPEEIEAYRKLDTARNLEIIKAGNIKLE